MLNKEFMRKTTLKELLSKFDKKSFDPSNYFEHKIKFFNNIIYYGKDPIIGIYTYVQQPNKNYVFSCLSFSKSPCSYINPNIEEIEDSPSFPILQVEETFKTNIAGLNSLSNFFNFKSVIFTDNDCVSYYASKEVASFIEKQGISIENILSVSFLNWRIENSNIGKLIGIYISLILNPDEYITLKGDFHLKKIIFKYANALFKIDKKLHFSRYSRGSRDDYLTRSEGSDIFSKDPQYILAGKNVILSFSILKCSTDLLRYADLPLEEFFIAVEKEYREIKDTFIVQYNYMNGVEPEGEYAKYLKAAQEYAKMVELAEQETVLAEEAYMRDHRNQDLYNNENIEYYQDYPEEEEDNDEDSNPMEEYNAFIENEIKSSS